MDKKFNVKFLIIVDEPIELSNLFERASKVKANQEKMMIFSKLNLKNA